LVSVAGGLEHAARVSNREITMIRTLLV
jgi:hypothetical protein